MIEAWAAILLRLPQSRLIFASPPFQCDGVKKAIQQEFTVRGIAPQRLMFIPRSVRELDQLLLFQSVDVLLSPPCASLSDIANALWMGTTPLTLVEMHEPSSTAESESDVKKCNSDVEKHDDDEKVGATADILSELKLDRVQDAGSDNEISDGNVIERKDETSSGEKLDEKDEIANQNSEGQKGLVHIQDKKEDNRKNAADYENSDDLSQKEHQTLLTPSPSVKTSATTQTNRNTVCNASSEFQPRLSLSFLSAVGLIDLVATSVEEYVEKAVSLGNAVTAIRTMRPQIREKLRRSPVLDCIYFYFIFILFLIILIFLIIVTNGVLQFEEAYLEMWNNFVQEELKKQLQE